MSNIAEALDEQTHERKTRRRFYPTALLVVTMMLGGIVATSDPASASHHGTGPITTACSVTLRPTLQQGSTHRCVASLQHFLKSIAYISGDSGLLPGPIDAHFGSRTHSAVRRYQQIKGLTQDGIVGSNTWNQIVADCVDFYDMGVFICHSTVPF